MTSQSNSSTSRNDLKTNLLTVLAALAIFAGMTCPMLPGRHSAAPVVLVAQQAATASSTEYGVTTQTISHRSRTLIALR